MSSKCLVIVKYYGKLNADRCKLTNKDNTSDMFQLIVVCNDIGKAVTGTS